MNDRDVIVELLARYTRALENRDGEALSAAFAPDGAFHVFSRFGRQEYAEHDVSIVGHDALRTLFKGSPTPPPERGWHYLTSDHIVDIAGDEATMHARFLVIESTAQPRPEEGWASEAHMVQGKLALLMVGYYESWLRKIEGRWVFARHHVKHSVPIALPSKS